MSTRTSASADQHASDRARQEAPAAGQAQEKAQEVAGQAQEKAQEIAGQAQEKGQQAAAQAKDKLREQLDQRSSQAAEQINQQASDLRAVSNSLREQGKDGPASAAGRLAEYAEKAGSYLRDKDSDALLSDAEDLARRQPWAVAAGALALGFAASRFLKASSSKRYSTRSAGEVAGTPRRGSMPPSVSPLPASPPAFGSTPPGASTPPIGQSPGL
jgi:F0F1-type ATP synthase membrane subunit b/b'